MKAMEARGQAPRLPPVTARYLVEWWLEIGPTSGEGPIGWQEIAAWERLTGIALEPFEAKAIRAMSAAFSGQCHDACKVNCPPPWSEVDSDVRDKVADQLAAMARAFSAGQKRGK